MSSRSYGQGVFQQSLGQGLAAAASMYATLSMQSDKLDIEQTQADARLAEAGKTRLDAKNEADAKANADAIAETTRLKKEADDKAAQDEIDRAAKAESDSEAALLGSIGAPSATGTAGADTFLDSNYNNLRVGSFN